MSFVVVQEKYQGPFAVLLELLEKNDLAITEVSLSKVADDFLRFIEENEVSNTELADFLVIASKLILLKTKELMPYLVVPEEEEIGTGNLEDNLRLYKEFVAVAEEILGLLKSERVMFSAKARARKEKIHLPPQMLTASMLEDSFVDLLKRLQPFFALKQTSMERIKSVSERIEELQQAILTRASFKFKEIVSSSSSKGEVVVSFLALLELMRRNIVKAQHDENHDIIIERI
jgi:segregation and condensation protein A